MSFGFSIGDCVLLVQLAWNTVQGARRACGEHDDLTREVSTLHKVLRRLHTDISDPKSLVNRADPERKEELEEHAVGCKAILKTMNSVLKKYNALGPEDRQKKRGLWQKIKFGNGEMKDLSEIRVKLAAHTSAIMMSLNLCSLDSLGRVEATLGRVEAQSAGHGAELRGLRKALRWVTANMTANSTDGSVWSAYSRDDQSFWRELRRELVTEGFNSTALKRRKRLIIAYIEELGNRGVFDDIEKEEPQYIHAPQLGSHRTISNDTQEPNISSESIADVARFSGDPSPSLLAMPFVSGEVGTVEALDKNLPNGFSTFLTEDIAQPLDDSTDIENVSKTGKASSSGYQSRIVLPTPQVAVAQNQKRRSPFNVQIEEVIDEEFIRFSSKKNVDESAEEVIHAETSMDTGHHSQRSESSTTGTSNSKPRNARHDSGVSFSSSGMFYAKSVEIEEVVDDDFVIDAHPNVYIGQEDGFPAGDMKLNPMAVPVDANKASSKQVNFAGRNNEPEASNTARTVSLPLQDLRFIFFREFRDFDHYQELEESYQAMLDEREATLSNNLPSMDQAAVTSNFITHSPYTPPATMRDLQNYRIPASYFHKFWYPNRVPIYLHGNVFDGISLANWMYNWTAYTFKDDSYQMSTMRKFGKTLTKLGSALTDIEHAEPKTKFRLPKDIYDQSGNLWAELENIINDIMSDAEVRLKRKDRRGRLEVAFVTRFCHEMIAGREFHAIIDLWLKRTEEWCKLVRFHPQFFMLWELWTET